MGAEIDRLEVQVEAEASKANSSLDKLVGKLDRIQSSLAGVNSRGFATMGAGINKVANAMNNLNSNTQTRDFTTFAKNLEKLNSVNTGNFANLSGSIKTLSSGIREISAISFNADGLNSIADSLNKLGGIKATAGTQNLLTIKDDLAKFVSGMNSIGSLTFDVNSLSTLLDSVSRLGGKASTQAATNLAPISAQLQNLVRQLNNIGSLNFDTTNLSNLITAIGKLGGASVQRAITNLPQLATAMNELMTTLSKAPSVSVNTIKMVQALALFASQGSKVGTVNNKLVNSLGKVGSGMSSTRRHTFSLSAAFDKLYASCFLVLRGIKKLWTGIESSMDYVETYNYWNVTMDKIGKEFSNKLSGIGSENAESYVESFRDSLKNLTAKMTGYEIGDSGELLLTGDKNLGLDPEQLMNFQAKILAVTNSVGLIGQTSTDTAKALSMLSADLSSFTNEDLSTVMTNLQSGLIGQSRALYKYGIDITNATLQNYAYEQGITKSLSAMTQSEKMQLRLLAVLDQSKVAWGDQANTLDSVANSYRILGQQVSNLGRILGNLFLPIVKGVLPVINGLVMALNKLFTVLGFKVWGSDWLKDLQDGISNGFDDSGLDAMADSADDTATALDDASNAAKKLNSAVRAFDELNVISTKTDTSSDTDSTGTIDLSGAISAALADYESVWEKAFADSESKAQEYADKITTVFTNIWNAIEPVRTAIANLWDNGLSKLADFTWTSLGDFYDNFLVPMGTWAFGTDNAGFTRLVNVINDGLMAIDWDTLNVSLRNFWIAIEPYAEQFGEGLIDFFEDVQGFAVDAINAFPGLLDKITTALNNGDPEKARNWGYALGVLATGLLALKGIGSIINSLATLGNSLSTLSSGLGALFGQEGLFASLGSSKLITGMFGQDGIFAGMSTGTIVAVGTALAALAAGLTYVFATNEEVRDSFSNAVDTIKDGLQPVLEVFSGTILPGLSDAWNGLMNVLSPLGQFLEGAFTSIWQDMINPALTYIGENVLPQLASAMENLLNNVLVPLGTFLADIFGPIFEKLSVVLTDLWNNVVVPLAGAVGSVLAVAFDALADTFNWVTEQIEPMLKILNQVWNDTLKPMADFVWDVFYPVFEEAFTLIGELIGDIGEIFSGLIEFVSGVFTGNWKNAWTGIKDIFTGIWDTLEDVVRSPLNAVLALFEGVANGIIDAWNYIKESINSISFDIPDWVPSWAGGGSHFGFNLEMSSHVSIPRFEIGGYPDKASLFWAGENGVPEMLGTVGGKTAVAGGEEITGIREEIRSTADEEIALLRQQNQLLQAILQKEFGITQNDIGKSARNYAKEYFDRTGKPAYVF